MAVGNREGFDLRTVVGLGVVAVVAAAMFLTFGPTANGSDDKKEAKGEAKDVNDNNPIVVIETTEGTIKARLFEDKVPKTVENFVELVNKEFYDGIIFHRVIKDFMVQTGCPKGNGTGGREDKGLPSKVLKDEFHPSLRHNKPGLLSMANAGPNTGDTQFFITTAKCEWLDDKHAIFGEVIEGMDVLRKIENTPVSGSRNSPRPVKDIKMTKVRIERNEK